jgi:hypothetical protein
MQVDPSLQPQLLRGGEGGNGCRDSLRGQDPNAWIPQSEEAQREAELLLPRIVGAILHGAETRDWNRCAQRAHLVEEL